MLRVLHAPVNIGNQAWVLSRHERQEGVQSDLVVKWTEWLQYGADLCLGRFGDRSWTTQWRRVRFGMLAPFRYDILHYYFGQSFCGWGGRRRPHFLWFLDLRLAKRLRRKVFMTLQGCDARLSEASSARNAVTMCHLDHCETASFCRETLDDRRRRLIERILPCLDRVFVLNPELAHYVPQACFLPYSCADVESLPVAPPKTSGPAVILHAPSNPSAKGTRLVLSAVERLQRRFPIEFIQVTGLAHEEAMKIYPRADLVIDQILAGWYGGFAVELMAMGKPVACYLREEDFGVVPPAMARELPLLRVRPQTLEADLERFLVLRGEWVEWGRRSRQFVLRWHHPARIAQAMVAAYRHPQSNFCFAPDPFQDRRSL